MSVFTSPRPAPVKGKTFGKPRNPLLAPSLFRRAGSHGICSHGRRQQAQQQLRHALKQLDNSVDDKSP